MFQLTPKHAFDFMRRSGYPWMGWVVMYGPSFHGYARVLYRYLYIGRVVTPIRRIVS